MSNHIALRALKFAEYNDYLIQRLPTDSHNSTPDEHTYLNMVHSLEGLMDIAEQHNISSRPLPISMRVIRNIKKNLEYRRPAVRPLSNDRETDPVYMFLKGFQEYGIIPIKHVIRSEITMALPQGIMTPRSFVASVKVNYLLRSMDSKNRYDEDRTPFSTFVSEDAFTKSLREVIHEYKARYPVLVMDESMYNHVLTYTRLPNLQEAYRLFQEYLEDVGEQSKQA